VGSFPAVSIRAAVIATHGALSAEPDELTLPGWLNAAKGSRSYNRVVHILELIHQNEQNVRNIVAKGAHIHVGPKKWPREHIENQRDAKCANIETDSG
jgi:hypothetical protein